MTPSALSSSPSSSCPLYLLQCPPVAVAIAKQKLRGKNFSTCNSVDFAVVDISDSMGWDSGPVKRELKSLQWTVADGGTCLCVCECVCVFLSLSVSVCLSVCLPLPLSRSACLHTSSCACVCARAPVCVCVGVCVCVWVFVYIA